MKFTKFGGNWIARQVSKHVILKVRMSLNNHITSCIAVKFHKMEIVKKKHIKCVLKHSTWANVYSITDVERCWWKTTAVIQMLLTQLVIWGWSDALTLHQVPQPRCWGLHSHIPDLPLASPQCHQTCCVLYKACMLCGEKNRQLMTTLCAIKKLW